MQCDYFKMKETLGNHCVMQRNVKFNAKNSKDFIFSRLWFICAIWEEIALEFVRKKVENL